MLLAQLHHGCRQVCTQQRDVAMVDTSYRFSPDHPSVFIPIQSYVHSFARFNTVQTLIRAGPSAGRPCSLAVSTGSSISANENTQHIDALQTMRSKTLDSTEDMQLFAALHRMDTASIATLLRKNTYISKCIMAHEHVIREGLDQDVIFCSLFVASYSNCGHIHLARSVFDRMHFRNVITWTTMITSYVDHGLADEALTMFKCMCTEGIQPNEVTCLAAMSACANADYLDEGMKLHISIASNGFDGDIAINTGLIKMYGQCGDIEKALCTFRKMSAQDVISWTALITVHAQLGLSKDVLQLFYEMERDNVQPNLFTFVSVIGACGNLMDLAQGRAIHTRLCKRKLHIDSVIGTSLVNMYAKCGALTEALHAFNEIHEPDFISFTAMITAYTQNGQAGAALEMYQVMSAKHSTPNTINFSMLLCIFAELKLLSEGQECHSQIIKHGFPLDVPLINALLYMYGKCGCLLEANNLFKHMQQRDVVSWTTLMAAFLEKGQGMEVFALLDQMEQEGVKPDDATYVIVLKSCSVLCMPEQGRSFHASIIGKGFSMEGVLGTALLEMYGKCGALEDIKRIFNSMNYLDQTAWNSIIMAHAQEGNGKKSIQLFEQMQEKIAPNEITFVGLLSGCSHAGMVKEGCSYFESMRHNYGITPSVEHYGSMVDLLGRGAYLDAAEDFIEKSPLRPNGCMWSALLGACQTHGDAARGKRAANLVMMYEPENAAPYVLLSRMYANEGKTKDAHALLKNMEKLGLRKKPGCTYIEVNNTLHQFLASEGLHKDRDAIINLLGKLQSQAKEMGYIPDTKLVLHDVANEVKEHLLGQHSERMALAFGLLNTPSGTPLHLAKNLRTCPDCHRFMKAISKIVLREIVLKDANRIHRFKDGVCSCDDYW